MISREQQILAAVIIYILGYLYSLVIANMVIVRESKINILHQHCFLKGKHLLPRGKNYYMTPFTTDEMKKRTDNCILTFWGLTHVILYAFLGYFCPDLFLETFIAGFMFEAFEAQYYDCHDLFDIFLNTLGFGIGWTLRSLS